MKYRLKVQEIGDPHENPLARNCILKYIFINIYKYIREGMREERERREKVVGKRERIWCFKRKLEIKMEGVELK